MLFGFLVFFFHFDAQPRSNWRIQDASPGYYRNAIGGRILLVLSNKTVCDEYKWLAWSKFFLSFLLFIKGVALFNVSLMHLRCGPRPHSVCTWMHSCFRSCIQWFRNCIQVNSCNFTDIMNLARLCPFSAGSESASHSIEVSLYTVV